MIAYRAGGPRELVSRDGRSTYVAVTLRDGADADADVSTRLEGAARACVARRAGA